MKLNPNKYLETTKKVEHLVPFRVALESSLSYSTELRVLDLFLGLIIIDNCELELP